MLRVQLSLGLLGAGAQERLRNDFEAKLPGASFAKRISHVETRSHMGLQSNLVLLICRNWRFRVNTLTP